MKGEEELRSQTNHQQSQAASAPQQRYGGNEGGRSKMAQKKERMKRE
jgi:hypothetical protein